MSLKNCSNAVRFQEKEDLPYTVKKRIAREKAEMIVGTAILFHLPAYRFQFKGNGKTQD